ncbi:MAG: glycoside hydrolase family 3 C-terminal domain-containing protein [Acidobacteria bacterium]|nr:glycoside hydrolase family 3 C-terminal domain-containing protein [Acidobacteriota bacterium]
MQRESQLPLIFAADFERGLYMRFNSTTAFPHAMAFAATGKPSYVGDLARVVAREARAIGVQWDFFPVADVNSAPANPIINTRSFGEDPQQVSEFVTAFLAPARENGMLTTVKHFPGHGNENTDSHIAAARVISDRAHLDRVELPPFRAAINAGVDAVMTAHVTAPALDPEPGRVATTSPAIVTHLLREELGFQGIIVTDAMDMNAVTRLYPNGRAVVEAIKAGNDVIVIPADIDASYNALLEAVRSGEIPQSRIDVSVLKVLHAKASVGLHKARVVDMNNVANVIARPENLALAQRIADQAVTLVRENGQVLPLKRSGTNHTGGAYSPAGQGGGRLLAVVLTDDVRSDIGHTLERQLRARAPDANILFVDPHMAAMLGPAAVEAAQNASEVVIATLVNPTAGKIARVQGSYTNSVSLDDESAGLVHAILEHAGAKTVLVSLGNPYVATSFPEVENYLCTFSNAPVSESSAVKALFGETAIHGRLPVTLPAVADRGAGLDRPAVTARRR